MDTKKINPGIIYDAWLSNIIKRPSYKIDLYCGVNGEDLSKGIRSVQVQDNFLYSKIPISDVERICLIEKLGFHLIETNVIFEKKRAPKGAFKNNAVIRYSTPEDEEAVVRIAEKSFLFSRFHMDPGFSRETADTLKAEWSRSYFKGQRGDHLVVADMNGVVAGFNLLMEETANRICIDLIAVDGAYRKQGIGSDLISFVEEKLSKYEYIKVGTQIANVLSLRLYENMGFKITEAFYTFHYHHAVK